MSTRSASPPVWASDVRVKKAELAPKPLACQQSGRELPPVSHSSEALRIIEPLLSMLTWTLDVEEAPPASTARAAIVVGPLGTLCELQAIVHGALVAVPTTLPLTRKSTWSVPAPASAVRPVRPA